MDGNDLPILNTLFWSRFEKPIENQSETYYLCFTYLNLKRRIKKIQYFDMYRFQEHCTQQYMHLLPIVHHEWTLKNARVCSLDFYLNGA